ncbi:hypothetical protein ACHAXT_011799 [Thalassiosira profunda]
MEGSGAAVGEAGSGRQTRSTAAAAAVTSGGDAGIGADAAGERGRRMSKRSKKSPDMFGATDPVHAKEGTGAAGGRKRAKTGAKGAEDEAERTERAFAIIDVLAHDGKGNDKDVAAAASPAADDDSSDGGEGCNINNVLRKCNFVDASELTAEQLAMMPTKAECVECLAPDGKTILRARVRISAEALALLDGNPHPPVVTLVWEFGTELLLRKCTRITTTLGPKERKKLSKEAKRARLLEIAAKSLEGAVGGDIQKLTEKAIKAVPEDEPLRHFFRVEIVSLRDEAALQRYLNLVVVDGAEERLKTLREKADASSRQNSNHGSSPWLLYGANESLDGPDGKGAIMKYEKMRPFEKGEDALNEPVTRNGVGAQWNGACHCGRHGPTKVASRCFVKTSNAAGAEDGFLWKCLWVKKCTWTEYDEATEAGTHKKPSVRYNKLVESGRLK